jgi:hypothetical protein
MAEAMATISKPDGKQSPHKTDASLSADPHEVMREQLEYLIEHSCLDGTDCACPQCRRYRRVRSTLLEIFEEPRAAGPALAQAA